MDYLKNILTNFFELLTALVLNTLIVLAFWGLRQLILPLISNPTDQPLDLMIQISDYGAVALCFIFNGCDIVRQIIKFYNSTSNF